jgi:hypothetical protein
MISTTGAERTNIVLALIGIALNLVSITLTVIALAHC